MRVRLTADLRRRYRCDVCTRDYGEGRSGELGISEGALLEADHQAEALRVGRENRDKSHQAAVP
jgi:hypothetical protein